MRVLVELKSNLLQRGQLPPTRACRASTQAICCIARAGSPILWPGVRRWGWSKTC